MELPPIDDPFDERLQYKRPRSQANRHRYQFIDDGEDAVVGIGKVSASGERTLLGTGFFVARRLVATACHVFRGPDISESDVFEVWQYRSGKLAARTIDEVSDADPIDVAVCRLTPAGEDDSADWDGHPIVGIAIGDPLANEVVGTFSVSNTLVGSLLEQVEDALIQQIRFRTHWELGGMEEVHEDGILRLVGHAFQTSVFVDARGSGGPLFDGAGFVIGMMNSALSPTADLPVSFALSIRHVLELRIGGRTVAEIRSGEGVKYARIAYLQWEGRDPEGG